MISFKQLQSGTPPDIEATTDDSDAELVGMEEAFTTADALEFEAAQNLTNAHLKDGTATFVIPGHEAGEVAEIFAECDLPQLEEFLDELRGKIIQEAEGK